MLHKKGTARSTKPERLHHYPANSMARNTAGLQKKAIVTIAENAHTLHSPTNYAIHAAEIMPKCPFPSSKKRPQKPEQPTDNMSSNRFPPLNLPMISSQIRTSENGRLEIFDPQRHKFVTLTAEEWVRQHFVLFLVHHLGYPSSLIANEISLNIGGVTRRCDTVIYSPKGGKPLIIVEYKAPSITITQGVFEQIRSYNSALHAEYLIVSNGMRHFCCHMDYQSMTASFLPEIPHWKDVLPTSKV